MRCIPRLYAAASLKHLHAELVELLVELYSAALCRGLIEATSPPTPEHDALRRIPRLYAAASLKLPADVAPLLHHLRIPRLYAAASLKRDDEPLLGRQLPECIPRLYAAASLKQNWRRCQ